MIPIQPLDQSSAASAQAATSVRSTASAIPSSPSVAVQQQKLRRAAAEFESILLSTFWKSMKESFTDSQEGSLDPAHGTLEDWGIQAMSTAVGKAGGLGLGRLILKQLEPRLHQKSENEGILTR